jgi:hypothetical protein
MKFRPIFIRFQRVDWKGNRKIVWAFSIFEFCPPESAPRSLLGIESDDESVWVSILYLNFKIWDKTNKV